MGGPRASLGTTLKIPPTQHMTITVDYVVAA